MIPVKSLAVYLFVFIIIVFSLLSLTNGPLDDDPDLPGIKTQTSKNSDSVNIALKLGNLSKTLSNAPISVQDDEPEMSYEEVVSKYILQHDRSPPQGFDKWVKYAKEKKCYLNRYDPIYRDLAPFMSLTVEQFRHRLDLAKKAPYTSAIEIVSGKLKNGNSLIDRFVQFLPNMTFITNHLDEPRVLFDVTGDKNMTLTADDEKSMFHSPPRGQHAAYLEQHCKVYSKKRPFVGYNDKHGFLIEPSSSSYTRHLLPIMSPTRIDPCFSDILVPSGYYLGSAQRGAPGKKIPWETRKPVMFWRGKTSGGHAVGKNYEKFHRQRMSLLTRKNSSLYDISFTDTVQCDSNECKEMREKYPFTKTAPFEENFKHKYLIDMDGNSFSGRYFAFLFSGSLVFKPTIFAEFFRDWLKPFVHYIPVELDLSDLDSKLQWALTHDKEARQIALNGQRFAEKHLQEDHKDCYTFLLILELARLQGTA